MTTCRPVIGRSVRSTTSGRLAVVAFTNALKRRPPCALVRTAGATPCWAAAAPPIKTAPLPTAAAPAAFRARRREMVDSLFDGINPPVCVNGQRYTPERGALQGGYLSSGMAAASGRGE